MVLPGDGRVPKAHQDEESRCAASTESKTPRSHSRFTPQLLRSSAARKPPLPVGDKKAAAPAYPTPRY